MITFIATLLQTEHDLAAAEDTTIPGPCSGQLQRIWWPQDFARCVCATINSLQPDGIEIGN